MNYSIEEIEAALLNAHGFIDDNCNLNLTKLINEVTTELTKPKWEPQVGEVRQWSDGKYWVYGDVDIGLGHLTRPLTPDEVPALKVAIEALELAVDMRDWGTEGVCEDALAKIKELTGG